MLFVEKLKNILSQLQDIESAGNLSFLELIRFRSVNCQAILKFSEETSNDTL